jgi:hypothetical protein
MRWSLIVVCCSLAWGRVAAETVRAPRPPGVVVDGPDEVDPRVLPDTLSPVLAASVACSSSCVAVSSDARVLRTTLDGDALGLPQQLPGYVPGSAIDAVWNGHEFVILDGGLVRMSADGQIRSVTPMPVRATAIESNGNFVVAVNKTANGVSLATIDVHGRLIRNEPIAGANASRVALAASGHDFLATWSDASGVVAARLDSSGIERKRWWLDASGINPTVSWSGDDYLLVWGGMAVRGVRVGLDGPIGSPHTIFSHPPISPVALDVVARGNDAVLVMRLTGPNGQGLEVASLTGDQIVAMDIFPVAYALAKINPAISDAFLMLYAIAPGPLEMAWTIAPGERIVFVPQARKERRFLFYNPASQSFPRVAATRGHTLVAWVVDSQIFMRFDGRILSLPHESMVSELAAAASGDGFVVATRTLLLSSPRPHDVIRVVRLNAGGEITSNIVIDSTPSGRLTVACSDVDCIVADSAVSYLVKRDGITGPLPLGFHVAWNGNEYWGAVNHVLVHPITSHDSELIPIYASAFLWTGSRFAVFELVDQAISALPITTAGTLGSVVLLPAVLQKPTIAWTGRDYLVVGELNGWMSAYRIDANFHVIDATPFPLVPWSDAPAVANDGRGRTTIAYTAGGRAVTLTISE